MSKQITINHKHKTKLPHGRMTFMDFLKGLGGAVKTGIGSLTGSIVGGYVILQQQQKYEEQRTVVENTITENINALNHYKEIMRMQKSYSECMRLVFDFKRQHGDTYGEVFLSDLQNRKTGPKDPSEFDAISAINNCRSVTTNYWREIFVFQSSYPDFVEKQDLEKSWHWKHVRFVDLIEKIDNLDGYIDAEKQPLYNRTKFKAD